MTTYNKIVKAFEDFCENHLQIKTFYSGQTWNFETETNVYPILVLLPQPSSMQRGKIVLTFNVFVADILNKDRTNVNEIYSDTLQIMADLVSYMADNVDTLGFWLDESSVSIEPFEESFSDVLAGWLANINLEIVYDGSTCNLPIE